MTDGLKGQMTIFDLDPAIWSGRTSPEPLAQTKAKTSEPSSKKQRGSSVKMPLFLDLRGASGAQAAASWVMGGALLGEYTMHSFGECPSVENASLLSQILEDSPLPKYCLSARACQGILRRAERRGKKLPELLEKTLIRQSACKDQQTTGPLMASGYQKNGTQEAMNDMYVVGTAYDGSQVSPTLTAHNAGGGQRMPDKDNFNAVITYGLDRASFNQGQNAQYDFSVTEEQAQTLVAKGPGGVLTKQSVPYVQEITKE